ncbi:MULTISPECIES: ABC transporter substrate-binding protein [unclassified Beijerinckia]|uniref:ABC transporter substrate-binding protein n=1 Tax=unclassified Beijerinckia TaxID=2638183 RepID=UPI00089A1FA8|nr:MULTISPECIES: ABC transporter substrate-binding protein [unclassified Beijerinckia]MDH7798269.1 NitT/TauT family transport system substrate-binding protein [Beijerinckia sp. GAS462]SED15097.1 NitT/TauT family transport system substrate-binding protein [Beijerinckia sp. 28-YEA-48]
MFKRILSYAGVGGIALALMSGAMAATKIKLGYSASTAFANAYVAADQGLFAKHGLDVEMILVPNSSTTPAALIADSLQIGPPTAPVTLQAMENGLDLVILGGGGITDRNASEVGVLAREGSGIKTAKDFEGKKVGTPGLNAFLHVMFREWMTRNGADWKKTTFVESPFAQLGDVMKAGQVDAVVTGDPFKTRALEAKQGYLVANYVSDMGDGIATGWFVASRKWATQNKEAAKAFQTALNEATALAKKDPAVLRKAIGAYIKLPEGVLAQVQLPALQPDVTPEQINDWSKICVSQGLTKKPTDPARVLWK